MTDMEIDEMEAGPEMNKAVAARVMGLDDSLWLAHAFPASYSEDIGAAWRVVNRLDTLGFWMTLLTPYDATDGFHVSFTPHGQAEHGYRTGHAVADTAPLAICRAALRVARARGLGEK